MSRTLGVIPASIVPVSGIVAAGCGSGGGDDHSAWTELDALTHAAHASGAPGS